MRRIRRHLSFATGVSVIALIASLALVACGGGSETTSTQNASTQKSAAQTAVDRRAAIAVLTLNRLQRTSPALIARYAPP